MEAFIVIAILGAVAWFFLSGTFKTSVQSPETMRGHELEDSFIELKKRILVTSAYTDEKAYERVYYRIKEVLGQIIARHQHYVLDVEAQDARVHLIFVKRERRDSNGLPYYEYIVPSDLDLAPIKSDVLLYLCFFLYLGGQAKGVGNVEGNPETMLRILDYLIAERDYPPASFFKGLVMKYGKKVYSETDSRSARMLLESAQQKGVGSAAVELMHLAKFVQLDGIKSIHA